MATTNFEVNGLIDTSDTVLNNINKIATAAGSFVTWDPSAGAWSVIPNATGTSVKSFDNNNIIGNINVSGSGITELYNSVSIEFPHRDLRDSRDYIELEIPQSQRFPQELDNRLEIRTDCVNDPVQAEYIAARELKQSRVDKIVEFRTDYTANGLVAGDLISITSTMYGYVNKLFRIITIEEDDSDGTILYSINGLEYDPSVYDTSGLTRKQRSKETQITPKCNNEEIQKNDGEANIGSLLAGLLTTKGLNSLLKGLSPRATEGQQQITPNDPYGIEVAGFTPLIHVFYSPGISLTATQSFNDLALGHVWNAPYSGLYKTRYAINWGGSGTPGPDGVYKNSRLIVLVDGVEQQSAGAVTGDTNVQLFEDHFLEIIWSANEGQTVELKFGYITDWPTAAVWINGETIFVQES